MLLAHAAVRNMPGSQTNANQAIQDWLLSSFDAGMDISLIARQSAFNEQQTGKRLTTALDAASGSKPTKLVINGPDGSPGRVSWVDEQGVLRHRPFDGAFPRDYSKEQAIEQCGEVMVALFRTDGDAPRDRTLAMLLMAKLELHTFDAQAGRRLRQSLSEFGMNEESNAASSPTSTTIGRLARSSCSGAVSNSASTTVGHDWHRVSK